MLREFGAAHAYLADTCAAYLHEFTTKRTEAVQATAEGEPLPDVGLAEVREMIDAGATEACLWAIHAHTGAQIAASAIAKCAMLLTHMVLSSQGDAVRKRCVGAHVLTAQRLVLLFDCAFLR